MVSPSAKRRAVERVVAAGEGTVAESCRALGLSRSSYYRRSTIHPARKSMETRIVEASEANPRYGYRRVTEVLCRQGHRVNAKAVQRVRRAHGLGVARKQCKLRRAGHSTSLRRRASRRNEVWSWDFVADQTARGTSFRVLTVLDEYTRECLAMHIDWSIRAEDVLRVLSVAMEQYGTPEHIRSDNGPEFVARKVQLWLKANGIGAMYITPGSPWENGRIESFHDKLRDECLNRESFDSLKEAQVVIGQWRLHYNRQRPHSSLGYLTPEEFAGGAVVGRPELRSGCALPSFRPANDMNIKPMAELYF
jgi:putative transposase